MIDNSPFNLNLVREAAAEAEKIARELQDGRYEELFTHKETADKLRATLEQYADMAQVVRRLCEYYA